MTGKDLHISIFDWQLFLTQLVNQSQDIITISELVGEFYLVSALWTNHSVGLCPESWCNPDRLEADHSCHLLGSFVLQQAPVIGSYFLLHITAQRNLIENNHRVCWNFGDDILYDLDVVVTIHKIESFTALSPVHKCHIVFLLRALLEALAVAVLGQADVELLRFPEFDHLLVADDTGNCCLKIESIECLLLLLQLCIQQLV